MEMKLNNESRAPFIQGMRAVSIFAVLVNHFWPGYLPSGYLGVDVFFVISGFVITKSLQANVGDSQRLFYPDFSLNVLQEYFLHYLHVLAQQFF
jgi:peptidoglycan/LPS O-acetylase OafA/YrhL